ncbi:hypothetical protein GCM10009554_52210 [Kribbella koreensis]|uniref:SDR family oxidoreductase n=1 Tax=Kribbella koreensis TaxID=57909 RepID=A0ABN1R2Z5_9ACTN
MVSSALAQLASAGPKAGVPVCTADAGAATGRRRPVGRTIMDIAEASIVLPRKGFITGTVLHADGGNRLV